MQALFCWLPDELNQKFEKHCETHDLKKALLVRDALKQWLAENGNTDEPEGKDSGMETHVSESEHRGELCS